MVTEFWAVAAETRTYEITVSDPVNPVNVLQCVVFAISGCDPTDPFDDNPSLPATGVGDYPNLTEITFSTSNPKTIALLGAGAFYQSGPLPSEWAQVATDINLVAGYQLFGSAQPTASSQFSAGSFIVDAVKPGNFIEAGSLIVPTGLRGPTGPAGPTGPPGPAGGGGGGGPVLGVTDGSEAPPGYVGELITVPFEITELQSMYVEAFDLTFFLGRMGFTVPPGDFLVWADIRVVVTYYNLNGWLIPWDTDTEPDVEDLLIGDHISVGSNGVSGFSFSGLIGPRHFNSAASQTIYFNLLASMDAMPQSSGFIYAWRRR